MIIRHPEKVNNSINAIKKKPNWIRTKITDTENYFRTKEIINSKNFILSAKKLVAQIFQNAGVKDMPHL